MAMSPGDRSGTFVGRAEAGISGTRNASSLQAALSPACTGG